jgi:DNA-binding transcriptional ArsR family regulator
MDQQTRQEIELLHQQVCMALADPTRLLIFLVLADGPRLVGDIAEQLDLPQSTISRHLKALRERSLVIANRQGVAVAYSLADRRVLEAIELLRGVLHDRVLRQARLIQEPENTILPEA